MGKYPNLTLAFLIAPLISAALSILLTPLATTQGMVSMFGIFGIFYLISLIFSILFGVPIYCLLLFINKINWLSCLLSGIAVGMIVGVLLHFPGPIFAKDLAILGSVGGASGIGFWLALRLGKQSG